MDEGRNIFCAIVRFKAHYSTSSSALLKYLLHKTDRTFQDEPALKTPRKECYWVRAANAWRTTWTDAAGERHMKAFHVRRTPENTFVQRCMDKKQEATTWFQQHNVNVKRGGN